MNKLKAVFLYGLFPILLSCSADGSKDSRQWLEQTNDLLKSFGNASNGQLTVTDLSSGLKEALRVGTETVVSQLSANNGFNLDPEIHIPLPESLQKFQSGMGKLGLSLVLDDLETRLNTAAEVATPKAKQLFWNAITEMSIDDAEAIFNGPNNSATQYFRKKMDTPLKQEFTPVIEKSLQETEAVQVYDRFMTKYQAIPFMPDIKADLNDYVVGKSLDGIFLYLAKEEAAIRENPAKRTTEILKRVFK